MQRALDVQFIAVAQPEPALQQLGVIAAHDQDLRLAILIGENPEEGDAVHVGHHQIEHDGRGVERFVSGPELLVAGGNHNAKPAILGHLLDEIADRGLVVDDKQALGIRAPGLPLSSQCHPPKSSKPDGEISRHRSSALFIGQDPFDHGQHRGAGERFGEDAVGADPLRQIEVIDLAAARPRGNGDDLGLRIETPQLEERPDAILDRHDDVDDHEVRFALAEQLDCLATVLGLEKSIASGFQDLPQRNSHQLVIVGNQD